MKNKIILLFLSALCILICCIQVKKNNPLLPDFQGDYSLTILHSSLPETLTVFHEYTVACSTGADKFSTYQVADAAMSVMIVDSIRFSGLDSIFFHFTGPFDSVVRIEGVRPNGKTVPDSVHMRVVNLFSANITTQLTLGRPLTIALTLSGADTSSYRLHAIRGAWRDSSTSISSKLLSSKRSDTISLSRAVTDTGPDTFSVYTMNSSGLKSNEIRIPTIISYSLPVISFTAESLLVSLGDTFPVTVSSAPSAEKYVWRIDLLKADTTASPNFSVMISDSLSHTLLVYGIDRYGYAGKTSKIIVYGRPFEYVIQPLLFPVDSKARSWSQWVAGVNNTQRAAQKNARYSWSVTPANYDSIKYGGTANDTMWLYFKDSAHAIVTVTVSDTANGSCAPYSKSVSVRRFAPSLTFKSHLIEAKTTDDIALAVSAADSNADGFMDSIFWKRGGKSPASYTSKDSVWALRSAIPDTFWVSAYARDNDGFLSARDSAHVFVKAFQPYLQPQMSDTTVFINSQVLFRAFGQVSDSTATIAKYLWDFDGNGTYDDSSTSGQETHSFSVAGTTRVIVKCRDSKGLESAPDTFRVTVSKGGPVVSGLSPDSAWVKDTVLYTVNAREINPNGKIVSYGVAWDGGTTFTSYTVPSSMKNAFVTDGLKHIRIFAVDSNAISSDTVTDSVYIKADVPVVDSIRADSVIFIADIRSFGVFAHPAHSTIDSFKIFWGGSSTVSATPVIFHSFLTSESGPRAIKAIVKNRAGFWSDTMVQTMTVRLGKPVVVSMTVDSALANIFINDPLHVTVSALDTNGTVDSIMVDTGLGVFGPWQKMASGQFSFARTFFRTESGARTVRAIVKDNDGIVSDTFKLPIPVRLGKPVVDSVRIDTTGNNIFVKDLRTYRVYAHDTNGTIRTIYAAWNGGTTPDTSVSVNIAGGGVGLVTHAYDTNLSGSRTARFWVRDDDTLISDTTKYAILVRLAPPVLWGDAPAATGDTTWVIINNGAGKPYPVHINHFDTNGTIINYYWNEADSTLGRATTTDTILRSFSILEMNHGFPMWIYGRDNDSILRGGKFIVFDDSAPPKPNILNPPSGGITSLTLRWINDDAKDLDNTQFQVMIGYGAGVQPTTILQTYQAGKNYIRSGSEYRFTFTPTSSIFSVKVLSKDARGSTSESDVQNYSY